MQIKVFRKTIILSILNKRIIYNINYCMSYKYYDLINISQSIGDDLVKNLNSKKTIIVYECYTFYYSIM